MTNRIYVSLKVVLDEAVQIVNLIKTRPLESRVFKALSEDMGSHQTTHLLHTGVRWFYRGNVLGLMAELLSYFLDHKFKLSGRLRNNVWLPKRTYIAAIFLS